MKKRELIGRVVASMSTKELTKKRTIGAIAKCVSSYKGKRKYHGQQLGNALRLTTDAVVARLAGVPTSELKRGNY